MNSAELAKVRRFSQVTRHEKMAAQTPDSLVVQGFSHSVTMGNVTLISNPGMSCHTPEKIPASSTFPEVEADCLSLSKTELRKSYPAEANTHRNMLSRQASRGAIIHPLFREFSSFLKLVGPIPAHGATLDRITNADPEYGPGKVRWADKRTQNGNKGDTLVFHYSRTGDTYTTSRLAKLQKVSPATIRKRHERGWTDDQIIEGKRMVSPKLPPAPKPVQYVASFPANYPQRISSTKGWPHFSRIIGPRGRRV